MENDENKQEPATEPETPPTEPEAELGANTAEVPGSEGEVA